MPFLGYPMAHHGVAVLPLVSATSDSIATSISRYIFPYLFLTLTTLYTCFSPTRGPPTLSYGDAGAIRQPFVPQTPLELESIASDTSWHTAVDVHINHCLNLSIFSHVNPTCPYTERKRHTCEREQISSQTAPQYQRIPPQIPG